MKVSRTWLQKYFEAPLPGVAELSQLITAHAFEIDEIVGEMLDVKVLPDRAGDCLSHRGIATELSAILKMPLKSDPLREALPAWTRTDTFTIEADSTFVLRHTGALVTGIKVGPSPAWLKEALESVGQRSINNIVDATNFVLLNLGQPSHACDATKSSTKIVIRKAKAGEKVVSLSGDAYELTDKMHVFANAETGEALDIAGIKGGQSSGVSETTTSIFVSAGNYDGTTIRKTAQALKLFTDASLRFQNRPSPELTAYGMRDLLALITDVAGGTVEGVIDIYNTHADLAPVSITKQSIDTKLGRVYTDEEIRGAFARLRLPCKVEGEVYTVTPPFERVDLTISENLIEEVGRIVGYDKIEPVVPTAEGGFDQRKYRGIERLKDILVTHGYIEASTQSFAKKGDVGLANPTDVDNPYLRPSLAPNMQKALEHGKYIMPLILPPKGKLKLFEAGTVFNKDGEHLSLAISLPLAELDVVLGKPTMVGSIAEYDLSKVDLEAYGDGYEPKRYTLSAFKPFSQYPFVLRDIAVWVPTATTDSELAELIKQNAGALLTKIDLFDSFAKDDRTSYAFRLVFQSMDRTLTDVEVGVEMQKVTDAIAAKGWTVR
ncbi:MAG: phenylalanine--tRNA ligase subunit beta [Patescibacteria group bacterium]